MKKPLIFITTMVIFTTGVISVNALTTSKDEILSKLTGEKIEKIAELKKEYKTYGDIASEYGKRDEFRKENLELKKEIIEEKVKGGDLSREEANSIITKIESRMKNCDGEKPSEKLNLKLGFGKTLKK